MNYWDVSLVCKVLPGLAPPPLTNFIKRNQKLSSRMRSVKETTLEFTGSSPNPYNSAWWLNLWWLGHQCVKLTSWTFSVVILQLRKSCYLFIYDFRPLFINLPELKLFGKKSPTFPWWSFRTMVLPLKTEFMSKCETVPVQILKRKIPVRPKSTSN